MSLRFDRKGSSSRVRSSFSFKSRTERERELMDQQQEYYMSWSYRQCQFACDYLNLMEPQSLPPPNSGVGGGQAGFAGGVHGKPNILTNTMSLGKRKPLPPPRNSTTSLVSTVSSGASSMSSCSSRSSVSSAASESNYADLIEIGFPILPTSHRDLDTRPVDPFRFSQATLEDTQEDELNAILGELSALQMSLDREIKQPNLLQVPGGVGNEVKSTGNNIVSNDNGVRTESPDNDSGFSDNASLLSSGSSLSASGSSSGSSTASCGLKNNIPPSSVLHANELAALVSARLETDRNVIPDEKAEKIRVALAKMRAASVTRLYVKAFSKDGSSKALMVEESMSSGRVLALLADKNHVPLSQKWALVEHIPHLHMERIYEDHENMVENLLMWTRDSKNKIYFVEREEKYDMFNNPQRYFLETRVAHGGACMDEHTKNGLIEEFFNHGVGVPEVESLLYLKAEGKKAWKKFPFVLRASGIYYYPKGRNHANSSKDLVCLATIDHNQQAYQGIGWKKKFKSPTEYGFVLKPARLQVKSHRHMKYLCAEDPETLRLWMVGLRIAKYGKQLWDNYRSLMEDLAHEDLDRFGRSVSLASMPQQIAGQMVIGSHDNQIKIIPIRQFSQESMQVPTNLHSENSNEHMMPIPPPSNREEGFESDCPVGGTIKRKPSTSVLTPKIPLTINTRSIVGDYINVNVSSPAEGSTVTLQRKRSLSGNSSASSNSSINSQIQIQSPTPTSTPTRLQTGLQGKPPMSLSTSRNIMSPKPATLPEESTDTVDYESLPPPPPELLMAEAETPTTPVCPPPPPPPFALSPLSGTVNSAPYNSSPNSSSNSVYSTPSTSSLKSSLAQKSSTLPTKKGVSFATELSERLKSRTDNNNSNSTNTNCPPPPPMMHPSGLSHSLNRATNVKTSSINFASPPPPPSPKKLDDPPADFLSDLQRVMQKKWQVAQKCNADMNTNPHEILGFRLDPASQSASDMHNPNCAEGSMPIPAQGESTEGAATTNNLNNVRAWVSQHYGNSADELPPLPNTKPLQSQAPNSPKNRPIPPQRPNSNTYAIPSQITNNVNRDSSMISVANMQNQQGLVIYENFQGRKSQQIQYDPVQLRNKKPPPPIPKRADSTHLSAHIVFN